jgi:predicted GIY-YIG superfamily endonuclease
MSLPATVFVLANENHEVCIGYTKDLEFALYVARTDGLCADQKVKNAVSLVYFEVFNTIVSAVKRVEELEALSPSKLRHFVEEANPEWIDLGIEPSKVPAGSFGSPIEFVKQAAERAKKLQLPASLEGKMFIGGDQASGNIGDNPASGGIRAKLPTGPQPPVKTGHDAKPWPKDTEGN